MTKKLLIYIILILTVLAHLYAADDRLHLIHADKSSGRMINGEKVRFLTGNVEAYQDTLMMFCDEAIFYEERNLVEFIGNVLIDDSHHKLWADKILYFSDTRIAHCLGQVKISGVNDSLYAEKFVYQFREGNAEAEKNMYLWDKQNNARLQGDSGRYLANLNESHVYGNARFEHSVAGRRDTLIITSKKMAYYGLEPKKAVAEDSVRIFKANVRASCDSATYFVTKEVVTLRINPLTWQGKDEMRGNMIDFVLDSLKIREIFLYEKAQISSLADSIEDKFNVLKGKTIQVSMGEEGPEKIVSRRNAVSIFRIEENQINQGTNSASSDSIIIYFNQGEADSIMIMGGTEGTFYPADWKGEIKSEY